MPGEGVWGTQALRASVGSQPPSPATARIVIVGAGFGGLEAAKALGRAGFAVTLIDRQNHHLFQPLLYQVATAALSATDVAEPVRRILRKHETVQVLLGEVTDIDLRAGAVTLEEGNRIGFDYLILATGAGHGYFGHDEWARFAPGLKTVEDALRIRSIVLHSFESAERATDPSEQQRLMTIAVVGGGPTGVELAGSLAELSRYTLAQDFRNIRPESARIMLIEAGPRLLAGFSERSSAYAHRRLTRLGVSIRTGEAVEDIGERSIRVSGSDIPTGVVLWAAGVRASSLAQKLGAETDRAGRVLVDESLAVRGFRNVFALGDVAHFEDEGGKPLPGLAQVAKQQGQFLGKSLAAHLTRGEPLRAFRYRSRGNTAIVGRHAAVFEQGGFRITGWSAWLAWAIIHVYLLVGFQHRLLVSMQWFWQYLTYQRGARLITGYDRPETDR